MSERTVRVDLRADVDAYTRSIRTASQATDHFANKVDELERKMDRLRSRSFTIRVHVERTGASTGDLIVLYNVLDKIDKKNVRSRVDVNTRNALAGARLLASGIAAIGPAGVTAGVVATGALGGLTTILSASVAGAGAAALAFAGIGDAVSAMNAYALEPTAENGKKVEEALRGMDSSARSFARTVSGLRPQLDGLRRTAQAGLLPGAEEGIKAATAALPQLNNMVGRTSEALGVLARDAGIALGSPFWRDFFDFMAAEAPSILSGLGRSIGNLTKGWAGLSMAFNPVAQDMISGLERMTAKFADWSTSLETNRGFQDFIAYVRQNGPLLMDTIGAIAGALGAIVQAAMPIGPVVLSAIRDLANVIADIARSDWGTPIMAVVTAIGALKIAGSVAGYILTLGGLLGGLGGKAKGATGALGLLGTKAGLVGAAAIGAGIGLSAVGTSTDEASKALMAGGDQANAMRGELIEAARASGNAGSSITDFGKTLLNGFNYALGFQTTLSDTTAEVQRLRDAMGPLGRAQHDAQMAQQGLNDAITRHGPMSQEAINASHRLADANTRVGLETQLAGKVGDDYARTVGRIAQGNDGAAASARQLMSGFTIAQLSAAGATIEIDRVGQAVAVLPDGKRINIRADGTPANTQIQAVAVNLGKLPPNTPITVNALTGPAIAALQSVGVEVRQIPGTKQFEVIARTEQAKQGLHNLGIQASQGAVMPVDANTLLAENKTLDAQGLARQPQGFTLDANGMPALGTIGATHGEARLPQTFDHLNNPGPARGTVAGTQGIAREGQTFPHHSNPGSAEGTIRGTQGMAREQQTMPVDANTSRANDQIGWLESAWNGVTWFVNVVARKIGFNEGGPVDMARGYADGGPIQRAANGLNVRPVRSTRTLGTGRLVGPGSSTSDSIPIRAARGEWVIRARVANQQGAGAMALLNAGKADIVPHGARQPEQPRPMPYRPVVNVTTPNNSEPRPVQNVVTVNNPLAERASDSVQQNLSRLADLGLFA